MNEIESPEELFLRMRRILNLSQVSFGRFLGLTSTTIMKWEKRELRIAGPQIQSMLNCGLNPLYFYGRGEVTLPGTTIKQARKRILSMINAEGK